MPNSNLLLLVSSIAKAHLEGHEEDPIEEMVRIAFRAALNNGVVYDENMMFGGALAGVMLALKNDPERSEDLRVEIESLKALNAMFSGIPVDLDRVPVPKNPVGVIKIWKEMYDDRG